MIKYKKPIKATLIFTDYETKTYSVFDEWITNSQERLWEFFNSYQLKLDQRPEPEPGEVDDWGEPIVNEPLFDAEIMRLILDGQDNFENGQLTFELVDIGVFGFIVLALPDRMDNFLNSFFEDNLDRRYDENFKLQEFII